MIILDLLFNLNVECECHTIRLINNNYIHRVVMNVLALYSSVK